MRIWVDTGGEAHYCKGSHWPEARRQFPELSATEATEALLQKGWLRVTTDSGHIYVERRREIRRCQRARLEELASLHECRLYDDRGRLLYEPWPERV